MILKLKNYIYFMLALLSANLLVITYVSSDMLIQIINIISFIIIIYIKYRTIDQYRNNKRQIGFFAFECIEAFTLIIVVTNILSYIQTDAINSFIFIDVIVILTLGYIDILFAKITKNKEFPLDRLAMYFVIAILYFFIELRLLTSVNYTIYLETLSFILFLDLFILALINGLSFSRSKDKKDNTNIGNYQSLSPHKAIEYSPYFDMIDYGIKSNDIKNIAITSVFGGGKSSIIESFLGKRAHPKEIHISLSHFDDVKDDDLVGTLQLKIIKHLFYKVSPKKLSRSKYTRKELSIDSLFKIIGFTYLLYSFLLIINHTFLLVKYDNALILHFSPLILSGLLFVLFSIIPINVIKVSTKMASFELSNDSNPFDTYLEEIVYFFVKTGFQLVIIEDIDRFQSIQIYNSLRELNILLNECEDIKDKITFIYAMNDYLLEEENIYHSKSKFFDLIIPIIPISSSYNSSGYLQDFFKHPNMGLKIQGKAELVECSIKPSEKLLNDISFYISDMRTLKTIYNEYLVTLQNLSDINGLDQSSLDNKSFFDKLFSIIVYKVFMPKDYTNLYSREGKLFDVFQLREQLVSIKQKLIQGKIEVLNKKLEYLKNYGYSSTLLGLTAMNYLKQEGTYVFIFNEFSDSAQTNSINTRSSNSIDINQFKNKYIEISNTSYPSGTNKIKFELWLERKLVGDNDYFVITSHNRNELTSEINLLTRELQATIYKPFNELINDIDDENIIIMLDQNKKIKPDLKQDEKKTAIPQVLFFMLRRGYINEDYSSYMNYFKEGKTTLEDKLYIQSYYARNQIEPTLKLQDFEGIIDIVSTNFVESNIIINYSLMDYLLVNNEIVLLSAFIEKAAKTTKFLSLFEYMFSTKYLEDLIHFILRNNSNIINDLILEASNKDDNQYSLGYIINAILTYSNVADIAKIFTDETYQIMEKFDRIGLYHSELKTSSLIANFNRNIKTIGLKFTKLTDFVDNNGFIEYINNNFLYDLNIDMITFILTNITQQIPEPTINYMKKYKVVAMEEYMIENIGRYTKNILLRISHDVFEDEKVIEQIYGSKKVDELDKLALSKSKQIKFKITNINTYDISYWDELFENNKVDVSISNLTSVLINYGILKDESNLYLKYISRITATELQSLDPKNKTLLNSIIIGYIQSDNIDYNVLGKIISDFNFDISQLKSIQSDIVLKLLINDVINLEALKKIYESENYINILYKYMKSRQEFNAEKFRLILGKEISDNLVKNFILGLNDLNDKVEMIYEYKTMFLASEIIDILSSLDPDLIESAKKMRIFSRDKDEVNKLILNLGITFRLFNINERKKTFVIYSKIYGNTI